MIINKARRMNNLLLEEEQNILKKCLHRQGKNLLIYHQSINTSLITALASTINASEDSLHQKLCERLERDRKSYTLPRKLSFIYEDGQITKDYRDHPELANFAKITLQLFSASTQRRLNVYYLSSGGDENELLTCKIINQGGYTDSISIARIGNKFYNINDRDFDSKHELSLEDVFKSSPHIDSDELIETFKSQSLIIPSDPPNSRASQDQSRSSGKPEQDLEHPELLMKRARSSVPFGADRQEKQLERVGIDSWSLKRQENQLINECGPGHENFESYQASLGSMLTPEQIYYMYYQNPFFQGKGENYYSSITGPSMSPVKSGSFKAASSQNVYPSAGGYSEGSQKRLTGRLKFFDDAKNYGFIIMDADQSDIFVHYDDLQKAGITKEVIKAVKNEMYLQIRFSFKVMEYFGKYKKSRKAVELIIIDDQLSLLASSYPPE